MKRALAMIALVLCASGTARAGCACAAGYAMPRVVYHAGHFSGHCTLEPAVMLRAKGLAMLLDDYVAAQVAAGRLPDKRLHVSHADGWNEPDPPLRVTRNRHALFIQGAQALDLRNLLRTIDGFGSPDWTSFCDEGGASAATALSAEQEASRRARVLARFERVLDRRVREPDVGAFRARQVIVHQVGELAVVYRHDELFYLLDGKRLGIEPSGFLPVRVGDRYVLQDGESIVAVERGEVVATHELGVGGVPGGARHCDLPLRAVAHSAWVNVSCHRSHTIVLTYSLRSNRFVRVNVQAPPGAWASPRRDPHLFVGECG